MKNGLLAIAAGAMLLAGCATAVPTDSGCCPTKCGSCAPAPSCKGCCSCKAKCDPCCNSCKGE